MCWKLDSDLPIELVQCWRGWKSSGPWFGFEVFFKTHIVIKTKRRILHARTISQLPSTTSCIYKWIRGLSKIEWLCTTLPSLSPWIFRTDEDVIYAHNSSLSFKYKVKNSKLNLATTMVVCECPLRLDIHPKRALGSLTRGEGTQKYRN